MCWRTNWRDLSRFISPKEKLYLFEEQQISEITKQGKVLSTIENEGGNYRIVFQRFTNNEGMIYFLEVSGSVYCFDPLSEEKIVRPVQDLRQDEDFN